MNGNTNQTADPKSNHSPHQILETEEARDLKENGIHKNTEKNIEDEEEKNYKDSARDPIHPT